MNDPFDRLAALPDADSSALRADRVKARARAALSPQTRRAVQPRVPAAGPRAALLWVAAAVSVLYVAEVVLLAAGVIAARFRG